MTVLTRPQTYQLVVNAGFSNVARAGSNVSPADDMVAICEAESNFDTTHRNVNASGSTAVVNGVTIHVPPGTIDRGLVQINNWWNNGQQPPNGGGGQLVTDAQADDPVQALAWAYKVSNGGQPGLLSAYWVTYSQGIYKSHLTPGQGANYTPNGTVTPTPTPTPSTDPATAVGQALLDLISALKKAGAL